MFLGRRLARVWPLHAALAVGLVLALPSWTGVADHAWRALSLTQAWSANADVFFYGPNAASWSLSAELFFYAMFSVLTFAVRRHPALMATVAIAGLLAYVMVTGDIGDARGNFHAYYVSPLVRLPELVLGIELQPPEMACGALSYHGVPPRGFLLLLIEAVRDTGTASMRRRADGWCPPPLMSGAEDFVTGVFEFVSVLVEPG